jgi:DNA-binding NarL/FixJ family response regulator
VLAPPAPTRVLVADPNEAFARELTLALAAEPRIEVVGWAAGAERTLELARVHAPDIVLLALELAAVHIQLEQLGATGPRAPKVILTGIGGTTGEVVPYMDLGLERIKAAGFARRDEDVSAMATLVVALAALANISSADFD